ncbi:MAG: zinc ribbon domain-containing protein [Bryobacteraceae bacterium]
MPEFCTCGAQLPSDARFCHKCGKPQRDEPLIDALEPAPPSPLVSPLPIALPVAPPGIGFQNAIAVRIALFAAVLAYLFLTLSVQVSLTQGFPLLWLALSGSFAVYLYMRRTAQPLSVIGGARLGWLTGLFAFAISLVLLTLIAVALEEPGIADTWRKQMAAHGASAANTKEMLDVLRSPAGVFEILCGLFVVFTLLPTVGGAIAAKLFQKREQEHRP